MGRESDNYTTNLGCTHTDASCVHSWLTRQMLTCLLLQSSVTSANFWASNITSLKLRIRNLQTKPWPHSQSAASCPFQDILVILETGRQLMCVLVILKWPHWCWLEDNVTMPSSAFSLDHCKVAACIKQPFVCSCHQYSFPSEQQKRNSESKMFSVNP